MPGNQRDCGSVIATRSGSMSPKSLMIAEEDTVLGSVTCSWRIVTSRTMW
jgi:hypothetical protein